MAKILFCKNCFKNNNYHHHYVPDFPGFYSWLKDPEDNKCYFCKSDLEESPFTNEEVRIIRETSSDISFLEAMMDLKEKDPIEYQLKMSQFKTQTQQQKAEQIKVDNMVRCPKCNSTSITTGARGVNWTWGLIGASKTVNRCANCGHTWKP